MNADASTPTRPFFIFFRFALLAAIHCSFAYSALACFRSLGHTHQAHALALFIFTGPKISVELVERFLDHFVTRGIADHTSLILFGGPQQAEHWLLRGPHWEEEIKTAVRFLQDH